jgi:hypothetical protein
MATFRAQFQRHLFPGLNQLLMNAFREKEQKFRQLLNVKGSSSAFEEFRSAAGVGLFVRTPEGVEASEDRFFDGFPKRYDHVDYGRAIGFTHQFLRDIKTNIAGERAKDLGIAGRATMETLAHDIFNSAFTGGAHVGPDAVALCSTSHPNIRGGVQSNIISPVGELSVTSWRRMLTAARMFFDDTGVRRISIDLKYLNVPPQLEHEALEIVNSSGRPDTMNRVDNVTKGSATVFVNEYLTDAENFFGVADKSQHKMRVFMREEFNTREFEEDKPWINWLEARFAMSYGWDHWMGIIGSNPA